MPPGQSALAAFAGQPAKRILKAALAARGWRYVDLAAAMGEPEYVARNKASRGTFSADWFLSALAAIDA